MLLFWIIVFSFLGSVGAIIAATIFLMIPNENQKRITPYLVSFATGTLLAAALLGLLSHSLDKISPSHALITLLVGLIFFFLIEKMVIWRHCHHHHQIECHVHKTTGTMVIIGDAFHNFVDGVIIAASFLVSIPIGIISSISVISHEIPQEVGDFAILLHEGYKKRKAIKLNTLSSLTTIPAAIIAYFALIIIEVFTPYVMVISAASFLYISLTDLFPELHHEVGFKNTLGQLLMILAGICTILFLLQFHF